MTTRNGGPRNNIGRLAELQRETKVPEPYRLNQDIVIPVPTRKTMREARSAQSAEDYNKTVFGDQWDAINAVFDDQPDALFDAFIRDVGRHFFGVGADDVEGKSQDSSES